MPRDGPGEPESREDQPPITFYNTLSARALPLQSPSTTSPSATLPATPTLLAEAARLPATELHCIEIFLRHAIYRRSNHTGEVSVDYSRKEFKNSNDSSY